jgi:hypothetical protein
MRKLEFIALVHGAPGAWRLGCAYGRRRILIKPSSPSKEHDCGPESHAH